MTRRAVRKVRERVESLALVLRRVPVGEADLMVTLFTRERGVVSVSARSARRVSSRLAALEPLHTLRVTLEVAPGEEIARLKEATLERPRLSLLQSEPRLQAAATLLGYARAIAGEGPHEVDGFDAIERGLDALSDASGDALSALVARAGAELLAAAGYALELGACVRCGTECPTGAAALFDPAAGGLVCRACGGGPVLLPGARRERIAGWLFARGGELEPEDAELATRVIELTVRAHGRERQRPRGT